MEKNAPSKTKIIKTPSVLFMNSNLRKAMHKRNMLRNKYRKGNVGWEAYIRQWNLTTAIHKISKLIYFWERCERGVKNQKFWKTIKPFMSSKKIQMIKLYFARVTKLLLMNGLFVIFSTINFQMWQRKLGLMIKYPMTSRQLMDLQKLLTSIPVILV